MHQNKILKDYRKLYRLYDDGTIFTAFDTETTGVSPKTARIIEIGAVKFNKDGIIAKWDSILNPEICVPPFIEQLTHITNKMTESAPLIKEKLPDFLNFIYGTVLIGHNINFDLNFLLSECEKCGLKIPQNKGIDTLGFSIWAYPSQKIHKLPVLADVFGFEKGISHRANDDADTCRQLFLRILEDTKSVQKL